MKLAAALAGLFVAVLPSPAGAEALTLDAAERIALERNPRIEAVAARGRAAAAGADEARVALLPGVALTESWTRSNNPVFVFGSLLQQERFGPESLELGRLNDPASLDDFRTGIEGRLRLFDRLRTLTAIRRARIGVAEAGEAGELVAQQVRLEVVRTFYGVVVARARLGVADDAVRTAEAEAKRVRDLFVEEIVTEADAGAAEVEQASFRQQQIQAMGDLATARAALAVTLGLAPGETPDVAGELVGDAPELPSEERLIADALERRPDLHQADLAVESREQEVMAAAGSYLPRVEASASVGRSRPAFAHGGSSDYTAGVRLDLGLFDPGREARLRRAKAARDAARAEARVLADAIRLEVVRAYRDTVAARERAHVARGALAQARETLRIVEDRYETGLTTITELLRAHSAWVRSRQSLLGARYDAKVGAARTLLASGGLRDLSAFEPGGSP